MFVRGWLGSVAILGVFASRVFGVSVIPSEDAHVKSLNGKWHFKLEQDGDHLEHGIIGGKPPAVKVPEHLEPFQNLDYKEDGSWKTIDVPGNWEMAGFSTPSYNQPDNAIGIYRLEFDVPADWKDRVVKLNFDGVQNGAEVYLNGQPVNVDEPSEGKANFHQGGFNAFQADLTPVVKFGEKNLLAVRVWKNTKEVDMDTGDYFFLGGIHRTVKLFSVPKTHLDDLYVKTKVAEDDNSAELRVILGIANPAAGMKAVMQLEGQSPVEGQADNLANVELVQNLDHPKLWSAEHPNLYTLNVDLKDASGNTVEHVSKRIGVREIEIKEGVFMVNHVPVKLTGMCRHDVYPTMGSAVDADVWRKDILEMKAANVNAIRTSHYPYGEGFYDLCDELGMYVAGEMAACWCPTDTDDLTAGFAQHARELARHFKNHPSVIIWAIGNENPKGKNDKVAADEIRKIDDTRPRLVSRQNREEAGVELDDAHYTIPADIAKAQAEDRRKTTPKIYLENPNDFEMRNAADYGALDDLGAVIIRTWDEVWKDNHIVGSFMWEWQDRAIADSYPQKPFNYHPETGIDLVKIKGLCDGFRTPRAGYYAVKVTYAPVKIDYAKPVVAADSVTVHAMNYLSFTDVSELNTTWHLMSGEKELKSDTAHPALAPQKSGDIKLDLPGDLLSQADALRVDFDYADGRNMVTYLVRLKPEGDTTPKMDSQNLAGVNFPHLNLTPVTYGNDAIKWHLIIRHPVKLENIKLADGKKVDDENALYAMPLADVKSMDADVVSVDEGTVLGHLHVDCADGHFSYRLSWAAAAPKGSARTQKRQRNAGNEGGTDIQELGWIFHVPATQDHFSWHRGEAYFSWYPPTDIGRISGTATPDSANQEITKITRPDAFDFNSTKYHCDWAMLADASGKGLGIKCDAKDRQQIRAGNDDGGGHILVVNQYCCPPNDISTDVIPDLYFHLKEGQSAQGEFTVGMVAGGQ